MAYSNRELLARIIKCEAGGEGELGMKAVATVIMNRVHVAYGEYLRTGQGDLRKVIFQRGQFDCVAETLGGMPNYQTIYNANPEQTHYDIADWALSGNKTYNLDVSLWYMNPFKPECPVYFPYNKNGVINSRKRLHCFFDPTPSYAQT